MEARNRVLLGRRPGWRFGALERIVRVCIIAAYANRAGGADVYTEELAVGLARRGCEVALVVHGASKRAAEHCDVFLADLPKFSQWRLLWRLAAFWEWLYWFYFFGRRRLGPVDLFICSGASCMAGLRLAYPRVPCVYLPHSRIGPLEIESTFRGSADWWQRTVGYWVSYWCERTTFRLADLTVRFSPKAAAEAETFYRSPAAGRCRIIECGVLEPPTGHVTPSQSDGVRLVSVGRLVASKNIVFLLAALGKLCHRAWSLSIVGGGPELEALQQQARALAIEQRVTFHGHQIDVDSFLREADLFLFPSRLESLGMVVLEAMAHGIPTLGFRPDGVTFINSNDELIEHGANGLLAATSEEFESLLSKVLDDPQSLAALGVQARQTYLARYRWDRVLDDWQTLIGEMCGHAPELPLETAA